MDVFVALWEHIATEIIEWLCFCGRSPTILDSSAVTGINTPNKYCVHWTETVFVIALVRGVGFIRLMEFPTKGFVDGKQS